MVMMGRWHRGREDAGVQPGMRALGAGSDPSLVPKSPGPSGPSHLCSDVCVPWGHILPTEYSPRARGGQSVAGGPVWLVGLTCQS